MSALFEPYTLRDADDPEPRVDAADVPVLGGAGGPGDRGPHRLALRALRRPRRRRHGPDHRRGDRGVGPEGRISPYDLGIWNDTQVEAFRRITRFLTAQGTVPAIQLAHAGRKASTDRPWKGGAPVGPDAARVAARWPRARWPSTTGTPSRPS